MRKRWKENINMAVRNICCENQRWLDLSQDYMQWQTLVLVVLYVQVMLQTVSFISDQAF